MKIGILTFQNTVNYGAKFQEYALQKYINDQGKNAEVIDYINDNIEKREKPLELKKQKSLKGIVKYFLLHKYQVSKLKKFNDYTEKYVKKSSEKYNKENIDKTNDIYDKFIVGSDQIWNTNTTEDDYTYYLDFVKDREKKYSYAASFGFSELPERNEKKVKELLEDFKSINVREDDGKNIVNKLTTKKSEVVIDPTFLLNKEDWVKFIGKPIINKKYIVAYMINAKKEIFEYIDDIANKENLEIVYISDFLKKYNNKKVISIKDASPEDFLNLIYNAEYIITGSFHAICMSIILEKNFFYMLNDNKVNSRLINLIKMAGLENREIKDNKFINKTNINYDIVKEKLNIILKKSKDILNKIIEEKSNDEN